MKSGKEIQLHFRGSGKFNPRDYEHSDPDCKGHFRIDVQKDVVFNFDILGPVKLPVLPLVTCDNCGATYEYKPYMDHAELVIAFVLLQNKKLLTKKQLKFLRVLFDRSQKELASLLGVDRSHYSKMENTKTSVFMLPDQQVRTKIDYLQLLRQKIDFPKDVLADIIIEINAIDDSGKPVVDPTLLAANMGSINEELLRSFG